MTQDRPCHVLDAGGGPGRYTLALAAQGYTMSLFDLSPALLALARQRIAESAPAVRERVPAVAEGSITDLARFGDEQFDAVLCLGGVLSHVIEAVPRRQALAELRRVAKPGALLFIAVMNRLGAYRSTVQWPNCYTQYFPYLPETGIAAIGPGGALTYYFLHGGVYLLVDCGGPRTGAVVWLQRSGGASAGRSPQRIAGGPEALANVAPAVAGDLRPSEHRRRVQSPARCRAPSWPGRRLGVTTSTVDRRIWSRIRLLYSTFPRNGNKL